MIFVGAVTEVRSLKRPWPRPRRKLPRNKPLVRSTRPGLRRSSKGSKMP